MLGATRKVGRLVAIRIASPVGVDELAPFEAELQRATTAVSGPVVFCTDCRGAQVMNEDITVRLVACMRRNNAQLIRTAFVLPTEGVVIGLQVDRLIRQAGSPARKAFRSAQAAATWLAETLNAEEQASLAAFLAEQP